METTESIADQVRKLIDEQRALLNRLRRLAPKGASGKPWTGEPIALVSWRWAFRWLSDATEALDDLSTDLYYSALQTTDVRPPAEAEGNDKAPGGEIESLRPKRRRRRKESSQINDDEVATEDVNSTAPTT